MARSIVHVVVVVMLLVVGMVFVRWTAHANPPNGGFPIERVSVADDESESDSQSIGPAINRAGRFVAFMSAAALVPADTNGFNDIFVRDTQMGTTTRVSISDTEDQANGASSKADISASGRYIVFSSGASNLVANDTNGRIDLFLRDRQLGTTTLLSNGIGGTDANGDSEYGAITSDGEYVAFISSASNLVLNDTNGVDDCFIVEVATGAIGRVLTSTGAELNAACYKVDISGGTPVVGFVTAATNVVPGDTNTFNDVYTVSIFNTNHQRITVDAAGNGANNQSSDVSVSDSGEYVAFSSFGTNLVTGDTNGQEDVFVRDTIAQETYLVSVSNDGSQSDNTSTGPVLSENGQRIAFMSFATTLVANDTNNERDIFVHDLGTGTTDRVSVSATGVESNDDSRFPAISHNGQAVVFESYGTTLVAGDTNEELDIFKSDITLLVPTPTTTPTVTQTVTPTPTETSTPTVTPTGTFATPTATPTPTVTPTGTFATSTETPTPTVTPTGTFYTPTETPLPTVTPTGTSFTPTETSTPTVTPTGTFYSPTATATGTATSTATGTLTSPSVTPIPEGTITPTAPARQLFLPLVQHSA